MRFKLKGFNWAEHETLTLYKSVLSDRELQETNRVLEDRQLTKICYLNYFAFD